MFKAVIFDMDGTLVNSGAFIGNVMRSLFDELGIDVPPEEDSKLVGRPIHTNWGYLKEKHGLKHSIDELVERNHKRYFEYFRDEEGFGLMPGIVELLEAFGHERVHRGVATSAPRAMMDRVLTSLNIGHHFTGLSSADDVLHGKPSPDLFLRTADILSVAPQQCIVFEDSTHGIAGAKAAGMKCVAYSQQGRNRQDLSAADKVVDCYTKLSVKDLRSLWT